MFSALKKKPKQPNISSFESGSWDNIQKLPAEETVVKFRDVIVSNVLYVHQLMPLSHKYIYE